MTRVDATHTHSIAEIMAAIRAPVEEATERAMENLRDVLAAALDAGLMIQSDTHALAESLYVQTTRRNDYDEALSAARSAFFDNASRYRSSPATESARANFEAIIAASEELPDAPRNVIVAAVATMLAYGNVWELRAQSQGADSRPWMSPVTYEWALGTMASFYHGLQVRL